MKTENTEMEDDFKKEQASMETNKKQIVNLLPASIEIVGIGINRSVAINGKILTPDESYKSQPVSQTFNWGYEGVAPAQLALAILMTYLPPLVAHSYYQRFKSEVIVKIPFNNFKMTLQLKSFMKDLLADKLKPVDTDGVSPYFDVEEYTVK